MIVVADIMYILHYFVTFNLHIFKEFKKYI